MLALAVTSAAHGEDKITVVLDLSVGSWKSLDDGTPAFVAARGALGSWILELPPELTVELRTVGGAKPATDLSSCRDSRSEVSPGPIAADTWHRTLVGLRARGLRPLLFGVGAAASDLGTGDDRRRIVVLTSGEDDCNGDGRAVIDALANGVEMRVIGLALPLDAAERFGAVAPTRNATTAESLLAALRWAVEDLTDESPADGELRITTSSLAGLVTAELVHTATQESVDPELAGDVISATVPPGGYALRTVGSLCGPVEVRGIRVQAGRTTDIAVRLDPLAVVSLEVAPDRPEAGSEIYLGITGAPQNPAWISVTPKDQPEVSWQNRTTVEPGETGAWIRLPDEPGAMVVRYHEVVGDDLDRIIADTEVEALAAEASLTAPTEIGTLEEIPVSWTGPGNPGDALMISPIGLGAVRFTACVPTDNGSPTAIVAPAEEGESTIRYVTGQSGRVLARSVIVVSDVRVVLSSPESVRVGRQFGVDWEGPAGEADYISLAAVGSDSKDYLNLHLAEHGSPALLVAPQDSGDYEVRYVRGTDNRVLRRAILTVESPTVSLSAPSRVKAGTRFDVHWTGPDRSDDFITIAPRRSRPGRKLDWSYTTAGNPVSLAAPFYSGTFEVRYVSSNPLEILASTLITVDP